MRGESERREIDRLIAELAGRQHGVVSRAQLEALGVGPDAIDRRIQRGRLLLLHRAVYAVGHKATTRKAMWMAAVLAGGPRAALSHGAAGTHWGFRDTSSGRIDVTVPGNRRDRDGIAFHRTRLPADETTTHDGIPITTVSRTIFDLAAGLNLRQLERTVNEAEILRLYDDLTLEHLLHRYPRRRGSRTVRALLARRTAGAQVTKSDLEVLFLTFADRFALPEPETNVLVEGFEVDCLWREARVVIELDSWSVHGTRGAFERDRLRSRVLQSRRWRCVPVTYRQLVDTPEQVARDVRALLATATLAA